MLLQNALQISGQSQFADALIRHKEWAVETFRVQRAGNLRHGMENDGIAVGQNGQRDAEYRLESPAVEFLQRIHLSFPSVSI